MHEKAPISRKLAQRARFVKRLSPISKLIKFFLQILQNLNEYLQLTKKGDQLIIGNCTKVPESCQHKRQLPISEIVDVFAGKQSKLYKDVFTQHESWSKSRSQPKHWDYFFSLKLIDNSYINFSAKNMETMNYWTDALNLLLGKKI